MATSQTYSRINRFSAQRAVGRMVIYAIMVVIALLVILPLVWTFATSLRVPRDSFTLPPRWIPTDWKWSNYADVFDSVPFGTYVFNSLKVTSLIVIGQVVTCSMAAYAFARLRFPFKNALFLLLMSSLMIPVFVTIIPVFALVRAIGLVDNHASLVLPSVTSAFGVFLLRQFFMTIPTELDEAAVIDGAPPWEVFVRVIVPLGAPGIAVLAILSFNGFWNEYFRPLIFLNSFDNFTIPLGLVALRGFMGTGNIAIVAAGIMMATVPVMVVLMTMQRYLIEGIAMTGLKG
ncbi:MAG: carbohydrate ABC transporter permease [Thermoflexales bacterium]